MRNMPLKDFFPLFSSMYHIPLSKLASTSLDATTGAQFYFIPWHLLSKTF